MSRVRNADEFPLGFRRIRDWCQRITEQTGQRWEFARVNQATFQAQSPKTLTETVLPAGRSSTLV